MENIVQPMQLNNTSAKGIGFRHPKLFDFLACSTAISGDVHITLQITVPSSGQNIFVAHSFAIVREDMQ